MLTYYIIAIQKFMKKQEIRKPQSDVTLTQR